MSQSVEGKLSVEDYQLIRAHQLGTPLNASRLKPAYLRLLQIGGLILYFMGLMILVLLVVGLIADPHLNYILAPVLSSLSSFIAGGLILLILLPQEQSTHIIVCKHGLLQFKKKLRGNSVEVVTWNNISPLRNDFGDEDYPIFDEDGNKITLSNNYQDLAEIITLLKQLSTNATRLS